MFILHTSPWHRFSAGLIAAGALLLSGTSAQATDIRIIGFVSATPGFSSVTLRADEIANFSLLFTSGTLRIEYWFFPTPYTGAAQIGIKSAEVTLGQLSPGFSFFNVNQTVPFGLPPDGFWCPSFQVTEFTVTGYRPVDWVNFTCRFIGVPNAPPTAFFIANPVTGIAPLTVNLDASLSSDTDGFIALYDWAISDGRVRSGVAPSVTFTSPGTYRITLIVTDNDGAVDSAELSVTVAPDPCAERTPITPGTTINGALSSDDCLLSSIFHDFYTISLPEAGNLTVSMGSQVIDSFVGVATTDLNTVLAADDDGGVGLNALLTTHLLAGSYVIIATSFDAGETGSYSLATQFVVPEPSAVLLDFSALAVLAALGARRWEHG